MLLFYSKSEPKHVGFIFSNLTKTKWHLCFSMQLPGQSMLIQLVKLQFPGFAFVFVHLPDDWWPIKSQCSWWAYLLYWHFASQSMPVVQLLNLIIKDSYVYNISIFILQNYPIKTKHFLLYCYRWSVSLCFCCCFALFLTRGCYCWQWIFYIC